MLVVSVLAVCGRHGRDIVTPGRRDAVTLPVWVWRTQYAGCRHSSRTRGGVLWGHRATLGSNRHREHALRAREASRRHAVQASPRHARAVHRQLGQTPRACIKNIHQESTSSIYMKSRGGVTASRRPGVMTSRPRRPQAARTDTKSVHQDLTSRADAENIR